MSEKNDNTVGLSRRRVLGGIGAIGLASAGAGLGTSAYFSDSELFENNTITAGTFELDVTQSTHLVDQDGIGPDEMTFNAALDAAQEQDETIEAVGGFLDITDAKPGDSYKYCWDLCVKHNPGYVQVTLAAEESSGNDNGVTHVDASGLLSEYMLAVVTIDDQQAGDSEEIVFQGTLGDLIDEWAGGGLVHAFAGTEIDPETEEEVEVVEYCHLPCESDDESTAEDSVEVCVYLYLPSGGDIGEDVAVDGATFAVDASMSPGNLVQGATFEADVAFAAEQCRHNETPFENVEVAGQE